jgi:hypothetical protein
LSIVIAKNVLWLNRLMAQLPHGPTALWLKTQWLKTQWLNTQWLNWLDTY